MTGTAIAEVYGWEAFDSRGTPTVACRVRLDGGGEGRAIAPVGASTGSHEAMELRDGGERYAGRGVTRAVESVNGPLRSLLVGVDAVDRPAVDATMCDADPDPSLGGLGGNAVLAVSLATTLALADERRLPLWRTLSDSGGPLLPLPMVNVVSGGAHAGRALDIQDLLVVPVGARTFAEAIEWAWRVRAGAAELLAARGDSATVVADEGGLVLTNAGNEEALALVCDGIARAGLRPGDDVALAVDVAANQFHDGGTYRLDADGVTLDTAGWLDRITEWCERYPVVSVEDVLAEDDWEGWHDATRRLRAAGVLQVLGDDLFCTDADRLARGIAGDVANAVLVKPNQTGTVTRAERVVAQAHAAGYRTVVSARSGDTEDHWLADLAVGWRAGQIKVGSTTRSERTAKWNRLLEIEADAGVSADFAGRAALG